jgi:dCTP deaminase
MFLPYQEIKYRCLNPDIRMIEEFSEQTEFAGTTYGCGPASYDLRLDRDIELWPGRSIRADAMEYIRMPIDLVGLLFSKSTWARVHIEHAGTVVDPGFRGVLRLEINMHGHSEFTRIPAGTGIVQILFARLTCPTTRPYNGRYQNQQFNQDAIFR